MDLAPAIAALEQLNRSQAAQLRRTAAAVSVKGSLLEPAIARGAKVYDLVTGQVGEVVDGRRENHSVQPASG